MNKTYKEIFGTNGIAAIFAAAYATDFAAFFGTIPATEIDTYVLYRHGAKFVNNAITDENATEIVSSVIAMNLTVWRKINAALNAEYNAIQSANETRTKRGTLTRETENENETFNAAKAFNDTDFVNDTKDTASGAATGTDTYNITETRTDINGNAVERVENEITLRKRNNLQMQIVETIINEICLTIY